MKRKDLTGYRFVGINGTEYRVLSGCEGTEVLYEEYGKNEPLYFCCDAEIVGDKLKGSYCASYTVSKQEFFTYIEALSEESKRNADTIAATLREKYYKIPTVFLKLVGEAYLKGTDVMDDIIEAHKFSSHNYEALKRDSICGCFCCTKIFTPQEINDWTPEPDGEITALCPYCGIDSVIGENSGYPITKDFLEEMRKYWF